MEAQVALIAAFRSSALLGLVSLIFLLTIPHRFPMNKMALLCSDAVQVAPLRLCFYLLFYLLLLSLFTHITSALITYDKGTLLDIGHVTLTWFRTLYPRIHPGHSRSFRTRRGTMATGDGTRNTVEKALEFATD